MTTRTALCFAVGWLVLSAVWYFEGSALVWLGVISANIWAAALVTKEKR